jgi:hypothetical protein
MTSAEAINHFENGQPLYPLHGQAYVTAIERVTDSLVKITLSTGDTGLHSASNLTVKKSKPPVKRTMRSFIRALTPR